MLKLIIISDSMISVPKILMGGIAGKVRKCWYVPKILTCRG